MKIYNTIVSLLAGAFIGSLVTSFVLDKKIEQKEQENEGLKRELSVLQQNVNKMVYVAYGKGYEAALKEKK